MTKTGQISLTDCIYFQSYSVKCILFYVQAFDDTMKFGNAEF